MLMKENGEMTTSADEVRRQWHHHFSKILNLPTMYHQNVIEEMRRLPHQLELDTPPTMEELSSSLSRLKKGKAGGQYHHLNILLAHSFLNLQYLYHTGSLSY